MALAGWARPCWPAPWQKLRDLAVSAGIGGAIANQRDAAEKLTRRQGDLDALRDLLPPQDALLVTTRDSGLLRGVATPTPVEALTPSQARGR